MPVVLAPVLVSVDEDPDYCAGGTCQFRVTFEQTGGTGLLGCGNPRVEAVGEINRTKNDRG
jgi:hypothetical protein